MLRPDDKIKEIVTYSNSTGQSLLRISSDDRNNAARHDAGTADRICIDTAVRANLMLSKLELLWWPNMMLGRSRRLLVSQH